jgi:hypothetical protein
VRKRAVLAAYASLIPAGPVANQASMSRARADKALQAHAAALADARYVPAPPKYSIVYDSPQNAGGIDPATGQPFPSVGQYADINTNTVHTTPGLSKRQVAQDVGQIFGYGTLTPGDRQYFQRILGVKGAPWDNTQGAKVGAPVTGDETFADYYAVAATGGMKPGDSLLMGNTSIDPERLRKFTAALKRLGKRHKLQPYK